MKAIVYTKYGPPDVLQLKEIDKPIPKNHTGVCSTTNLELVKSLGADRVIGYKGVFSSFESKFTGNWRSTELS